MVKWLLCLSFVVCAAHLFSDPPGRGSTWPTSDSEIDSSWDSMTPIQKQSALADSIAQSDPFMWASLTQEQKQQKVNDYERYINLLTPEQRSQFLSLNAPQRESILYAYYAQKTPPGDALKQTYQQNQQDTFEYNP